MQKLKLGRFCGSSFKAHSNGAVVMEFCSLHKFGITGPNVQIGFPDVLKSGSSKLVPVWESECPGIRSSFPLFYE